MKYLSTLFILAACTQNILAKRLVKRETNIEECKFVNTLLGKKDDFDCCTLDRIDCTDGHVVNINNLDEVTVLDLPESVGNMPYLENLDLYGHELTGNLPKDISTLKSIKYLKLNNNKIGGLIPDSICDLPELEILWLQENNFEGNIPSTISKCKKLKELQVSDNKLSGELPTKEIEKIPELGIINLSNNEKLYGRIPYNKDLNICVYDKTNLCYDEKEKKDFCEYPETHYDCAVCKDDKVSKVTDGICTCNEGYTGAAYIECTKADNNNNNNNNSNNNNDNNSNDESGVISTLSSMKLLQLALALFTIGMLYI